VLRRADGSVEKTILPDGRTVVSDSTDDEDTSTQTTGTDGTTVKTPTNTLGEVTSVSGAGVTPMSFGINPLTGQETSLTTYASGSLTGTGTTTSWNFDPASGRLLNKSYAGTATNASDITYGYGTNNTSALLHTITRPASTETLAYNDGSNSTPDTGDVSTIAFQDNGTAESTYNYNYDIIGRTNSVVQTSGNTTQTVDYAYTADGQLQSESQPWAGPYMAVNYGYYAGETGGPATAPKSVSLTDGGNTVVGQTYTYNPQTQRLETVSSAGMTDTYEYRPNTDLVASLTSSNNITASYQYEANTGRLQSLSYYSGTTTIYSISYEYNANDQRTSATETQLLPDDSTQTRVYTYTYDSYDHLSGETIKDGSGTLLSQYTYTYDALGNRTDTGYSVNALNQYTLIPGVEDTLTYDARGNMTYDGTRVMTYDAQDRLTSVVNGAVKEEYDYDYQGRRTVMRTYDASGENWTLRETRTFAYDGWNLIAEFVTDATHTTPTLARAYTWGLSLGGGVGGLLSITDYLASGGPKTYTPIFDGNGNVVGLADATGQVVATYTYDPYGKLLSATGPAADVCPFRFATMYYDDETGLYYDKMRYYSPDIGRWIIRDPAQEDGGVNLYAYCEGDPVNGFDPTGLDGVSCLEGHHGNAHGSYSISSADVEYWAQRAKQSKETADYNEGFEVGRLNIPVSADYTNTWSVRKREGYEAGKNMHAFASMMRASQSSESYDGPVMSAAVPPTAGEEVCQAANTFDRTVWNVPCAIYSGTMNLVDRVLFTYSFHGPDEEFRPFVYDSETTATPFRYVFALREYYERQTDLRVSPNAETIVEYGDKTSNLLLSMYGAWKFATALGSGAAAENETVIGKVKDLAPENLRDGESSLLDRLPDQGNPQANWQQNSGVLRQEMGKGLPIRDASVDSAGNLTNNTGFLRAERGLLQDRGWTYDPKTTLWNPPPTAK
jgi:RHS repeat-associated protein